jgi:flavin-binding protein dodecin
MGYGHFERFVYTPSRERACTGPSVIRSDIYQEDEMSIAKVSEISSTSKTSFEDAIQEGLKRAQQTLRNVRSAWIKEQQVRVDGGKIVEYQVNMAVTFVLDD